MSVNSKLNVDFTTKITAKKSAWEHVSLARSKERPTGKDYLPWLFDYFTELHGDRLFGDDPALVGGIAYLAGKPVTVIVQEKEMVQKRILPIILAWFLRKVIENPCVL